MNVYELLIDWPRGAVTASGGRYMALNQGVNGDTEFYTRLDLAESRIAELAEQGIEAKLSKARKATDA